MVGRVGGRQHARVLMLAVLAVAGCLAAVVAVAHAAGRPAFKVTKAGKPAVASGRISLTAEVRNSGKGRAKRSLALLVLSRDGRFDAADLIAGTAKVPALKPRRKAKVRFRVAVPAPAPPGPLNVLACADGRTKKTRRGKRMSCRAAGTLTLAAAPTLPAAPRPPASPAPAPTAAPSPVPSPVPTATPAPQPAPETAITEGPSGSITADDVTFAFTSTIAGSTFECQVDGNGWSACSSPHVLRDLPGGERRFEVRAVSPAAVKDSSPAERVWTLTRPAPAPGPADTPAADPAEVAPELPETRTTTVGEQTSFLYEGPDAVQKDVAPGAIAEEQVAVYRGCVSGRMGNPIAGVRVTVLNRPELGRTATREDGCFDLAVDGGGAMTIDYEREGYVPTQRTVAAGWEEIDTAETVVLVPYDAQATEIDLNDPAAPAIQVAQGSELSDGDGERQATLMFEKGTDAEMTLPDGTKRPLTDLRVRATEYTFDTAQTNGEQAMPGDLPATSGYTYAAEFSVDQAVRAGAESVTFDKPVVTYVENFAGIDVGIDVPSGWYDREAGVWKAEKDGRVIKVLSVAGGVADVDADGDGDADTADELGALGMDEAERKRLAGLYAAGIELWRVPVVHFSPYDFNYPFGLPDGAAGPRGDGSGGGAGDGSGSPSSKGTPANGDPKPDCGKSSSIIGCEDQSLGEVVNVQGTPFALTYQSRNTPGRREAYRLKVPVGPAPAVANSIAVTVTIAGRTFSATLPRSQETWVIDWDGRDGYGRMTQGEQNAHVKVGYLYDAVYMATPQEFEASFGQAPNTNVRRTFNARRELEVAKEWDMTVGGFDARGMGFGGWRLDAHHLYDPAAKVVYLGDGSRRSIGNEVTLQRIEVLPGTQDGLQEPGAILADPDGDILVPDPAAERVRRVVAADGTLQDVAGTGVYGSDGDGGPAAQAQLASPRGVAVAPDGAILIADTNGNRIRRIGPSGNIRTFAGGGAPADGVGDALPATEARLRRPAGITVANDGAVFIAESGGHRIRRVGPEGIISTYAGDGVAGFAGDGGVAAQARVNGPEGLAVAEDGTLYFADTRNDRIRRILPDGTISTVAGGAADTAPLGDGGPAREARLNRPAAIALTPAGALLLADTGNQLVRRVAGDTITTIAGGGNDAVTGDGLPLRTRLGRPSGVAVTADGTVHIADAESGRVLRIRSSFDQDSGGDVAIPAADGSQVFLFDTAGRHRRTIDALTRATVFSFAYDTAGRLVSVTDRNGRVTAIERDEQGEPTAIVAPGGQRTTLAVGDDGWLDSVTNHAGESVHITSSADGLISEFRDPLGQSSTYTFDADGRLTSATNVSGGLRTLERTDIEGGFRVVEREGDQTTTYTFARTDVTLADGRAVSAQRTTVELPHGGRRVSTSRPDGVTVVEREDGTVERSETGPDPRFGMLVPIQTRVTSTTPGGRTSERTASRTVALEDPLLPLTMTRQTDQATVNGVTTRTTFDVNPEGGGTVTITQPSSGREYVRTYDDRGRKVSSSVPGQPEVVTSYDALGRPVEVSQGTGAGRRVKALTYDERDRLVSERDASGRGADYAYDDADRVVTVTRTGGRTVRFAYDAMGNQTAVEPALGVATAQAFNAHGSLTSFTPPGMAALTRAYAPGGRLTKTTIPGGESIVQSYDAAGRPAATTTDLDAVRIGYRESTDQITTIERDPVAEGAATQRVAYDQDGNVPTGETVTGDAAASVAYAYASDRLLASATLTAGSDTVTTAYGRDAAGLPSVAGPYAITRDQETGRVTAYAAGADVLSPSYDGFGREGGHTRTVGGTQVATETIARDGSDRIVERTTTIAGETVTRGYEYDGEGRLTYVREGDAAVEAYVYDTRGNRISATRGADPAHTATYDDQDRVTAADGVPYAYDAAGRMTGRGGDTFTYAPDGAMLTATVGGDEYRFTYDGMRRRVAKTGPAGTTLYYYGALEDPMQVTAVRGPDGALVALRRDLAGRVIALERGGVRWAVETDAVGTPVAVIDSAGTVVKRIRRDAFGALVSITDNDPALPLPVGFAGGIDDSEIGLVHMGAREYDPETGRFTTRDPALFGGGQSNLYAYTNGDPVNRSDPSGLISDTVDTYIPQPKLTDVTNPFGRVVCGVASGYAGPGGGAKLCYGPDGSVSLCVKAGAGAGANIGLEFPASLPGDSIGITAEAGGAAGGIGKSVSASYTWDPANLAKGCFGGKFDAGLSVSYGPGQVGCTFQEGCGGSLAGASKDGHEWADLKAGLNYNAGLEVCKKLAP